MTQQQIKDAQRDLGAITNTDGDKTTLLAEWTSKHFTIINSVMQSALDASLSDLRANAENALKQYSEACHQNEAEWGGYGEMIVPEAAELMTQQAENALKALNNPFSDKAAGDPVSDLSRIIDTVEAIISDIKPGVLASGPVKQILETTVIRIDAVRHKLAKAALTPTPVDVEALRHEVWNGAGLLTEQAEMHLTRILDYLIKNGYLSGGMTAQQHYDCGYHDAVRECMDKGHLQTHVPKKSFVETACDLASIATPPATEGK